MHTVPTIDGVTVNTYKQDRLLHPESDGYLGQLYSGYAVLELVIDPGAHVLCLGQRGRDIYNVARGDWMQVMNWPKPPAVPEVPVQPLKGKKKRAWLDARGPRWAHIEAKPWYDKVGKKLPTGTQVFRKRMMLDANSESANTFVGYPNNLLALVEFVHQKKKPTNVVRLWKVAIVSQHDDRFFLTVQSMHKTTAHQGKEGVCFPRLRAHATLHDILVESFPEGVKLPPESDYQDQNGPTLKFIQKNQGLVTNWYEARGTGVLYTKQGEARVNWRDVQGRPRKAFLVPGEVVQFEKLGQPTLGQKTKYRDRPRKSQHFKLQAYGVTPVDEVKEDAA